MITGIHHVALKVADFNKAIKFYTEALGLPLCRSWGEGEKEAAMLDTGSGIIELFAGGDEEDNGLFKHLALVSNDVDGDYQKALDAGATEHIAPKDFTIEAKTGDNMNVRLAFVVSPTGELVEFFDHRS